MPKLPAVAAMTVAYDRPALLQKWIEHHGALFGRDNLYVLSQGPRAEHDPLLEGINSFYLPRTFDTDFDEVKASWFSHQCAILSSIYTCVVVTDMDELLCLAPGVPGTLVDHLLSAGPETRAPFFFNLIPPKGTASFDWSRPVLDQVHAMEFAPHLCNPMALYAPVTFVGRHHVRNASFVVDPALHLYHMKYLDLERVSAYYDGIGAEVRGKFSERDQEVTHLKGWSRGRKRLNRWITAQHAKPLHKPDEIVPIAAQLSGTESYLLGGDMLTRPKKSKTTPVFAVPPEMRQRV